MFRLGTRSLVVSMDQSSQLKAFSCLSDIVFGVRHSSCEERVRVFFDNL